MAKTRAFGTIRKLQSGRFQARYWHLGKQISAGATFPTKGDAHAWLSSVETDINRGERLDPRSGTVKFGAYATEWLEHRSLRPRTRDTYASQLRHIVARFERAELRDITPGDVRAWHGRLARSDLNPNTTAKVYRLFRTIMATAVADGLLRSNPVGIKGAAVERSVERPLLTWDEVGRLADAIDPRFRALVWLAATSGLRFGELTGLDRSRVDLAASTVRVDRALGFVTGQGATLGPPKSDAATRVVALPATIIELLRAHMDTYVARGPDALVFTSFKGRPLLNRYFAPSWERAKEGARIDETVRFHDLRHLAGTAAASAGASLREVMARMGHSSSEASLRYLKASEARDHEIASAIDDRMQTSTRAVPAQA
ncbi:MAG: tyrosine recombinase XerC [Acidimicrobiia bacterium]